MTRITGNRPHQPTRTDATPSTNAPRPGAGESRPTPAAEPVASRAPATPAAIQARSANLIRAIAVNGLVSRAEESAIKRHIQDVPSQEELKLVHATLKSEIQNGLIITPAARSSIMTALFERQTELERETGKPGQIPVMMTRAVGEDIFGMGAVDSAGQAALVRIGADGNVTAREKSELKGVLGKVEDEWQLARLHTQLRSLVGNNLVTSDDRRELSRAYGEAHQRVTGSAIRMTRAIGEDAFGVDHNVRGTEPLKNAWETASRNGMLSKPEAATLARSIEDLRTGEALFTAFTMMRETLDDVKMDLTERRTLASAFAKAAAKFDPHPLPIAVTRALNEDIFGMGLQLDDAGKSVVRAGTDETVSKTELTRLKGMIGRISSEEQYETVFGHVRALVRDNVIPPLERQELASLIHEKGRELGTGHPVTRGMAEDVFGTW